MDAVDARLVDLLRLGIPLADRPFALLGAAVGLAEEDCMHRICRLLSAGVLTRLGPLYQIEQAGGACLLAALAVPAERFEQVAARVSAHREVAHASRREHRLNLWFVVASAAPQEATDCLRAIEAETGLVAQVFPSEREYPVDPQLRAGSAPMEDAP